MSIGILLDGPGDVDLLLGASVAKMHEAHGWLRVETGLANVRVTELEFRLTSWYPALITDVSIAECHSKGVQQGRKE